MCENDQESAYMNAQANADAIEDQILKATKELQAQLVIEQKENERLQNKLRWAKAELWGDNSEGNKLHRITKVLEEK